MNLYTYIIAHDTGLAPNPFWNICTLVVCKPNIRKTAQPGDWIAGFGSKNTPVGDLSGKLIYAMQVTDKITMQEYDTFAGAQYPKKIPSFKTDDNRLRVGDCIYDFSSGSPVQRTGMHNESHQPRDIGGTFALLSKNFYYFGRNAIDVPAEFKPVVPTTQGHKSRMNEAYKADFVAWLQGLGYKKNRVYGAPAKNVGKRSWDGLKLCKGC